MTTDALTLQLLAWVTARPRTYQETMEAWRTTCPRLTIREDAIADGLVSVESAKSMRDDRSRRRQLRCLPTSDRYRCRRAARHFPVHPPDGHFRRHPRACRCPGFRSEKSNICHRHKGCRRQRPHSDNRSRHLRRGHPLLRHRRAPLPPKPSRTSLPPFPRSQSTSCEPCKLLSLLSPIFTVMTEAPVVIASGRPQKIA